MDSTTTSMLQHANEYILHDPWQPIKTIHERTDLFDTGKSMLIQLLLDSGRIVEGDADYLLKNWIRDDYWKSKVIAWCTIQKPLKRYALDVLEDCGYWSVYLFDRVQDIKQKLACQLIDERDADHIARLYSMQWKVDYYGR